MEKQVCTRFAPSPTGLLHLGSVRTALFNYLFASHHQGKFLVRFEDTDAKRNHLELVEKQLQDLKWLGLKIDATVNKEDANGPYLQSQRLSYYQKYAQILLAKGQAYYCFCSSEELSLERKRQIKEGRKAPQYNRKCFLLSKEVVQQKMLQKVPFCVRLQVAFSKIEFDDLVYGKIKFAGKSVEDFVLLRTNGYPTYNFAVVIDDHLMDITHVWRGSDHLSNTVKQIVLYQSFQWKTPYFGHLTLLQIQNQKKMSKRVANPVQYLSYYQEQGYLPEAVFNYLSLLGWTPDKFQEIFTSSDLIAKFAGRDLNKAQSTFSLVKLNWINHKHIVQMLSADFINYALPFCQNIWQEKKIELPKLKEMILFFQKEIHFFAQLPDLITKTFFPQIVYQKEHLFILQKNKQLLEQFLTIISSIAWKKTEIERVLLILKEKSGLNGKLFFLPIRLAVAGLVSGPQMTELLFFLGKKRVIANVEIQLQWIEKMNH